jgi:hypothetical protein
VFDAGECAMKLWHVFAGLAILLAGSAAAQTTDGTGGSVFVPAHSTACLTNFGISVFVTNNTATDAQYEFGSLSEWQTFVANPNPGVIHSTCPTAPQPALPPPPAPVTCTDSTGATHAVGSTFMVTTPGTESCTAAGFGAGATGTAQITTTTTEECLPGGTITPIGSPVVTVTNTSQCRNIAGGSCVPFDLANPTNTCEQQNATNSHPLCEWTAAHNGFFAGPHMTQQVCWVAFEFKSQIEFQLSSDLCTCNATAVPLGQVTPTGAFSAVPTGVDCAAPPNSSPPVSPFNLVSPACPNGSATCIVQPMGACN